MEMYPLYIGIVLCVLSVLMRVGWLNFLIDRYEGFQKLIRKKKFSVDSERIGETLVVKKELIGFL